MEEDWRRKGATLSDKTARKEFGLTQDEIEAAIDAGQLQYRVGVVHGNPWLRLLRCELKALMESTYNDGDHRHRRAKAALVQVPRDLKRLRAGVAALEVESGEVWRGRLWQPDRERFRRWLRQDVAAKAHGGPVALAVEGCTGWRYVVEEITAAGYEAHLAEPADTQAARGRKRHAKTDRSDSRLLRELLHSGDLPESWIPPEQVLEWRERVRLYKSLVDQRTQWTKRIHAELYQHGVAVPEGNIRADKTRAWLASDAVQLSAAGRQRIDVGYRMIDATDAEALPLKAALQRFGTRQPACKALVAAHYGIGGLIAVVVWSELGDCRRFSRSMQVVRHSGLDVTVDSSDRRRANGYLTRQGPETLRWALYEAAKNSSHHRSPDHAYYAAVKERHDGKLAAISVARQLARRCYHTLRAVPPDKVYAIPD